MRGDDFALVEIPWWYWTVRYDWRAVVRARQRRRMQTFALLSAIAGIGGSFRS